MNGAQKTIKGLAIALAVMIIMSIVSACVGVGMIMCRVFQPSGQNDGTAWEETVMGDQLDFTELKIELKSTSLRIEQGDEFQILADEDVVEFRRSGDTIAIEEKGSGFFDWWNWADREVKVVLPKQMNLRKAMIDMGAGTMMAAGLVAEEIELDLGAGRVEIDWLMATQRARINSGAGLLIVRNAELRDLDLDMGVGKVELAASLHGRSKISAGVGKLDLTLMGAEDDYQVRFDAGIGAMNHEGVSLDNPNGKNLVEIDGGVGAIDLRLRDNR